MQGERIIGTFPNYCINLPYIFACIFPFLEFRSRRRTDYSFHEAGLVDRRGRCVICQPSRRPAHNFANETGNSGTFI